MYQADHNIYLITKRWKDWRMWQIQIPLTIIMMIWCTSVISGGMANTFHKVFASGELILFAALLLIGVSVQFGQIRIEEKLMSSSFDKRQEITKFYALLLFFIYGIIKYDLVTNDYFVANHMHPRLIYYSILNITVSIFAVSYSNLAFWRNVQHLLKEYKDMQILIDRKPEQQY